MFTFVCASPGNFTVNEWTSYSYSLVINDIDGDLDYIYAAANTGIIAIDRITDSMNTIVTFSDIFYDFPIGKVIADKYRKFNLFFTGREYVYHYDWFNDTIVRSKVNGLKASGIQGMGIDEDYVYIRFNDIILRTSKFSFGRDNWERTDDTADVHFKYDMTPDSQLYVLPLYRYFNNRKYDFTCYYNFMNTIWAGTNGAGIYKINLDTGTQKHLMHGTGSVDNQAIAMDSNGNIWIAGLRTVAITSFNPSDGSFRYFPVQSNNAILDNDIVSISCSRENILFGTNNGYAFYYSLVDSQFRDIKQMKGNILFRSAPLDNNTFIVSSNLGLAKIDLVSRTFKQKDEWYMPSVIDLEIINDSLYFVSSNRLFRADTSLTHIESIMPDFPVFNVFQIDKWNDDVYIMDNAYIHMHEDTVWNSYPLVGFFGDIFDLDADSQYIWICGRDGVGRFSKNTKTWKIYNKKNTPMPATFTYSIISHKGILYGGTGKAFFQYNFSNPMSHD